jgi:hypothetical protein
MVRRECSSPNIGWSTLPSREDCGGDVVVEIQFEGWTPAALEVTWSVLAAQGDMATWAPIQSSRLERPGGQQPDGVGAIRVLKARPATIREQITAFDAPHRLEYQMLSGLPVRDYHGTTLLSSHDGGTNIVWTVSMRPRLPGIAFLVRRSVRGLVKGLVEESTARESHDESA